MLLGGFCADTANIWQLLGYVVTIIKIVIPLVLIILGMLDLGKAVISNDDKAINGAVTKLVKRFVAAIVMFFVPTIVSGVFGVISNINLNNKDEDVYVCVQCLTNVSSSKAIYDGKSCEELANNALGVK